jgi:hypothetical protein
MLYSVLIALTLAADPAERTNVNTLETTDIQGTRLFPARTGYQISALRFPLAIDRPLLDTSLKDILDFLQDIATPPKAAKDPSKRIVLLMDYPAFKKFKADPAYNVEDEKINLPKLNGASLETALRMVTAQLNATFIVKGDYILITTWEKAIGRALNENEEVQLIHWAAEKKPLDEVLAGIADRYEHSIVISNQAAAKAKKPVTAKFLNVPLAEAVETLADMNGLQVVRKSNLFYLVDAAPSSEPEAEPIKTLPRETKNDTATQRYVFPYFVR